MSTATITEEDAIREAIELDAAIERYMQQQSTAADSILLSRHGLRPPDIRHEYENRVRGLRVRQASAGTPKQFAAAEAEAAKAVKEWEAAQREIDPKIAELQRQIAEHRDRLRGLQEKREAATQAFEKMKASREMILERLLNPILEPLLRIRRAEVNRRHKGKIAKLRDEAASMRSKANAGIGGDPSAKFALARELEEQLKAAEAEMHRDLLNSLGFLGKALFPQD